MFPNTVVTVDDGGIRSVTANGAIPAGAETIDLGRYTGTPGMVDMHTHVTYYVSGRGGPRRIAVTVVLSQKNGMKALEAGSQLFGT